MAVAVAAISPADAATGVAANYPITVDLTDAVDIDESLVEVIVNGVSCTTADGNLDYWGFKTISGGAVVTDATSITVGTLEDWYERSGETITVVVKHNSSTISTTTFTCRDQDFIHPTVDAYYWADGFARLTGTVWGDCYWYCYNTGADRCAGDCYYQIAEQLGVSFDAYYYVAHLLSVVQKASGVVGVPIRTPQPASGVVQGYQRTLQPASGVVQGWFRAGQQLSGIVAISFRYGQQVSGIVGTATEAQVKASGVVYKVLRDCVIEVHVMDDSTYTQLTALGVTWS